MSSEAISLQSRAALVLAMICSFPLAANAQQRTSADATQPAAGGRERSDDEAATRFKQGLKLFDEGDYALALVEFQRAYQLAPNYRALYNIALVNAQLGRYSAATRAFEQYLHDGGAAIGAERQAQVRKSLDDLKLRTATLELSVSVPHAEVQLDGKPLEVSLLHGRPLLVDAGEHTLQASAPGYQLLVRPLALAGTDRAIVRLDLVPIEQASAGPAPKPRHLFVPGLAATGAFAAGAVVSGLVMLNERSRLSTLQNTVGSSPQNRSSAANAANAAAAVADVLTSLALVAGGVSLYLSLQLGSSAKSPEISVSPGHVFFSGAF